MAPVFAAVVPGLQKWNGSIDGGKTFRGKRIFGDHKTWRGLVTGIIAAIAILWVQVVLTNIIPGLHAFLSPLNYSALPILLLGALFGIGALGGDAIKSFFKRQINITPGKSWFPFDQIDYIIGGAIATSLIVQLTFWQYVWVLVLWLLLHVVVSYIGYKMHLKERPI